MRVTRAPAISVKLTPHTRALKVDIPPSMDYLLTVSGLEANPYAVTDDAVYFDLHDNNQLSWPKAHKATITRNNCDILSFTIIKDQPLAPALSTTDDCEQEWCAPSCDPEPEMPCAPEKPKAGCGCASLQGATCVSCLSTTTTVAIHNPAY